MPSVRISTMTLTQRQEEFSFLLYIWVVSTLLNIFHLCPRVKLMINVTLPRTKLICWKKKDWTSTKLNRWFANLLPSWKCLTALCIEEWETGVTLPDLCYIFMLFQRGRKSIWLFVSTRVRVFSCMKIELFMISEDKPFILYPK